MDPILYFLAEHYPWWGIPSTLIMAEVANHFRRGGRRIPAVAAALFGLMLGVLSILYFTHNGLVNVRPAMQNIEHHYKK